MKEFKTGKEVVQAILDGEKLEYYSESSKAWKELQYLPNIPINKLDSQHFNNYRIKPKTILIGNVEVPEPVRDINDIKEGDICYCPEFWFVGMVYRFVWEGSCTDLRLLKRGLVHKTKEAALLHGEAMIKISGGSYE